jgi:hypothetical protein
MICWIIMAMVKRYKVELVACQIRRVFLALSLDLARRQLLRRKQRHQEQLETTQAEIIRHSATTRTIGTTEQK